jgi:hypothetical protein
VSPISVDRANDFVSRRGVLDLFGQRVERRLQLRRSPANAALVE